MARHQAPHLNPQDAVELQMREHPPAMAYDGGAPKAWQKRLRAKLRRLMGYAPPASRQRVDLAPRTVWTRTVAEGTIEKILFTAEPGADVSAYVCLPASAEPPYDWFICLQGHSTGMHNSIAVSPDESRSITVEGDRDFALGCMRRGIAALCIEQRGFGERALGDPVAEGAGALCRPASMRAILLGRTMIAQRVFDVDRGLDYLNTRGDVNRKRIGVMGNSGGGTTTLFSSALLRRIRFAMPSCYFCTFADSILRIRHCECNYIPGLYPVAEMADVMGLFAPRPVVIVAGKDDPIFPIAATRKAFRDVQRIYDAFGAKDHCRLVIGEGGHRFYAADAWPVMQRQMAR